VTAEKICVVCGADCAARPRLKDSQGRYACQSCVEAKRRPRQAAKAKAKPTEPVKAPKPAAAPSAGAGDAFDMDQFLGTVHTADANPCPKCGMGRAADAVVCMQCGFDSAAGRAMSTKVGKDKPKKVRSAPRLSGGSVSLIIIGAMLVLLPLVALVSPEAAAIALIATIIWNLVAYAYMVGAAFRDDDKFWGWLGILFWVPLAGQFCVLAFVLYYCTIGSHRGIRKLNYWASFFAQLLIVGVLFLNNPDMFTESTP
jgi:hypothetical protein